MHIDARVSPCWFNRSLSTESVPRNDDDDRRETAGVLGAQKGPPERPRLRPAVVAFFDRFARNFYEGVMIQKELAGRRINIVAIREGIDTSDDSASGKFYRHIMLANGQYWRDTTSERVRSGQKRARAEGKHIGRLPALDANQVNWARRMAAEKESFRSIARALGKSPTTVMRAVLGIGAYGE